MPYVGCKPDFLISASFALYLFIYALHFGKVEQNTLDFEFFLHIF